MGIILGIDSLDFTSSGISINNERNGSHSL
jgi:hypothetical protein